jgi:FHA domain-containing protein
MNRKAKLWDLFLQHFRSIRNDAEDDFHELYGKAFVEAYAAQVERLSQAQEDTPTAPR